MKTSSENYNSLLHLYFPFGIIGYSRKTATEKLAFTWYCVWVLQVISDLYRITEVLNVNNIFPSKFLCTVPSPSGHHRPEAEFLDKIQSLKSFPPPYSQMPLYMYSFAWDVHFFKLMHLLTVSVKEKGGNLIENHIPFAMVYEIHNRNLKSETLQIMLRNLNVIVQ